MTGSMCEDGLAATGDAGDGPAAIRHRALSWAFAFALAMASGCGAHTAPTARPSPAPAPKASAPRFNRLSDANTLAILTTANDVDLAYARIAATRASSRDVKAFARRLTQDHASLNSGLNILSLRVDITPREEEISRVMRDQGAARQDSLRTFTGRQFDSAYVANELRYHEELLVAIDRVFLPSVRRTEIRDFLTTMRQTINAHRAHAEQLQAALAVPTRR